MPTSSEAPVLVTGATGKQGGATARALLASGIPVRALVRDPNAAGARGVAARGAELVTGDLTDRASLDRAVAGVRAVFSVQMPAMVADGFDFAGEVTQAANLIAAARHAKVAQFVHTSVTGAGQHTQTPGWAEGRWAAMEATLNAKAAIQQRVRAADFGHWTLLKPGFFMENFLPSNAFLFPHGVDGGLVSVLKPETRLSLVAVDDIGNAAAAAIADPETFNRIELELASDYLSMTQAAQVLSQALGTHLAPPDMTAEQALAAGMPGPGANHEWLNVAGQPGRPHYARELGLQLTSFETWCRQHMSRTS